LRVVVVAELITVVAVAQVVIALLLLENLLVAEHQRNRR
jgi:hypothetical protein